jgi:hypothetical protein
MEGDWQVWTNQAMNQLLQVSEAEARSRNLRELWLKFWQQGHKHVCSSGAIAMTQAAVRPRVSFEEYIDICAQTEERYELVRGELHLMNPSTVLHYRIAKFLEQVLDRAIEDHFDPDEWATFREVGQRTEVDSSRLPDLAIASRVEAGAMGDRRILITPFHPPRSSKRLSNFVLVDIHLLSARTKSKIAARGARGRRQQA